MYDITNRESFNNVARWLEEAKLNGNAEMCFVVVGNKCDMEVEYLFFVIFLVVKFLTKKEPSSPKIMILFSWKYQLKLLIKLRMPSRKMQNFYLIRYKRELSI